jgi:hypothetical protein
MESKEVYVFKNTQVSRYNDYSEIDTSLNYFKLNNTIYEIKSCSQLKDAEWKYEWDINYMDTVWIHFNFISEKKINYGSYEVSLLQINKMPFFSFYGALFYKNRKIKFNEGSVFIEHKEILNQIVFKLVTIEGDTITGHYRGSLKYTASE